MDLVSLTLFLGTLVPEEASAKTVFCPAQRPCKTAFASYNPITLKCGDRPKDALVQWQYLEINKPDTQALTFIQSSGSIPSANLNKQEHMKVLDLVSRSEIESGNLKFLSPRVQDTGIYTCKYERRPLALYEIEFQDISNIYISHVTLGQSFQPNHTVNLGDIGTAKIFTVWNDWQRCDRCGTSGEMKRLGFCYVMIIRHSFVVEELRPCGLSQSNNSQIRSLHKPELRIKMCEETCNEITSTEDEGFMMVIDNYHTYLHADVLLTCPMSSVYEAVYWEHGNKTFTHLMQMMTNSSYVLDQTTGGGTLTIHRVNKSDEGLYRCYIEQRLVGEFHVMTSDMGETSEPTRMSMKEYIMFGLVMLLGFLFFLSMFQICKDSAEHEIH
ncbi:protein FAM187B [Anomaloglossus baeobatrachus]|uniref:protein FAM187B n=1 Tax=Anomaloglossus baeobatrachus TaxID=238106 RepID=UPI003F5085AC